MEMTTAGLVHGDGYGCVQREADRDMVMAMPVGGERTMDMAWLAYIYPAWSASLQWFSSLPL
eukprot:scaffold129540_cov19-Tisochrysis_lutea.AAC.1